jgi:uncharacterized protein (TIGR02231 family)
VTAVAEMELEVGNHRIFVEKLPMVVIPESVRVSGQGMAKVQIASVDVRRSFYERPPVARVREIEDKILELSDQKQVLQDEDSILRAQKEYLDGLRMATAQYAKGLARGKTKIEDYARLAEFLSDHERAVRASIRDLEIQSRDLDDQLEKLEKELNLLQVGRSKQGYQANIDIVAETSGQFTVSLSYLIRRASWRPLYDIRLVENEEDKELDITILAEVDQNSGVDWNGVALSVSTSRPALSQRAPELKPWYIDELRPIPAPQPKKAMASRLRSAPQAHEAPTAMIAGAPDLLQDFQLDAEAMVARQESTGPSTTFHVAGQSDIPGDGSPHKTTISRSVVSPEIDFLAVPKQVDAVFRRVKAVNETGSPLLAGNVNLFSGADYIGSVELKYTPPGDEIELLFGTEERITIERELTQRAVEKTRLRDRRELSYGYEVKINNLLPVDAKVEVQDHIPVPRHEEIKVELEKAVPNPDERSDLNLIKWKLVVPSKTEKSIQYEYVVSHPRQMRVVGLID